MTLLVSRLEQLSGNDKLLGSIMKNFTIGLLLATLICSSPYAADIYNGTLIDAHSQKGKLISSEKISEHINKSDVDLTLLSFRGAKLKLLKPTQTFFSY